MGGTGFIIGLEQFYLIKRRTRDDSNRDTKNMPNNSLIITIIIYTIITRTYTKKYFFLFFSLWCILLGERVEHMILSHILRHEHAHFTTHTDSQQ